MPFVADLEGTRVFIGDMSLDELRRRREHLKCPACGARMTVVRGEFVQPHFRHLDVECAYEWDSEMSQTHLDAQRRLYESHAGSLELADVVLEAPIPMDWRPRGRIADVLVGPAGGFRIVHEVQISPIRRAELVERSKDYLRAGIGHVVWWLGSDTSDFLH